jgi:hypothetical protein
VAHHGQKPPRWRGRGTWSFHCESKPIFSPTWRRLGIAGKFGNEREVRSLRLDIVENNQSALEKIKDDTLMCSSPLEIGDQSHKGRYDQSRAVFIVALFRGVMWKT